MHGLHQNQQRCPQARASHFEPRALPLIACACERWGISLGDDWWAQHLARHNLQHLTPAELSSLAVAAAVVRHSPDATWIKSYMKETGKRLSAAAAGDVDAYPPQALCTTASALSQLRVKAPAAWLQALAAAVRSVAIARARSAAEQQAAYAMPGTAGSSNASSSMRGTGSTSSNGNGSVKSDGGSSSDASSSGRGSGEGGGLSARPLRPAFLQNVAFNPQGLATIIQSMGKLRASPGAEWLSFYCALVAPAVPLMRDGELLDLCCGLGALRCEVPPELGKAIAMRAKQLAPHTPAGRLIMLKQAYRKALIKDAPSLQTVT